MERLPSEETEAKWVSAYFEGAPARPGSAQFGRWFINGYKVATADPVWICLRDACRAGELGRMVQCTTAEASLLRRYSGNAIIRIETDDWRDEPLIWRIERTIRALGITTRLYYRIDSRSIGRLSGIDAYESLPIGDGAYQRLRLARLDGRWDDYSESDWNAYEILP